ncbi:MAG: 1,4-alpha-glucan branching protein GlgB [Candidatus Competibacteraceae bacterium]|nr:1,4-alpha-glucan branching protein GlgB [Candidatus Competibacteraceae bacterium]MBK7982973.1 1,4-alpha-glucan branching protein GlgB [Candidatus Competibacteraceae bacterium]MBK9951503.1 1,4-alpha-glucan branching protein GlgB [Candidatus Competibacteraceae bacterium]
MTDSELGGASPTPARTASEQIIADAVLLGEGRHPDPFRVLGRHGRAERIAIRAFWPGARQVYLVDIGQPLQRVAETDLFEWQGKVSALAPHYQLAWTTADGRQFAMHDPYSFAPQLTLYDLHLFNEGRHLHAYRMMGAHPRWVDGIAGVLFSVWAPNAERVSVVGDFNAWQGLCHPLRRRGHVWELFVPGLTAGLRYQFEIRVRETGALLRKSDPYGRLFERRPEVCSIVADNTAYSWRDESWMLRRRHQKWSQTPLSVYEVHLASWQRDGTGDYLSYQELARRLVAYVSSLGFTHIELMPVTEHPLDASWGYQTTGYFAPTSRHGAANDFRWFVDYCHQAGIGVILDWVPGHFPKDVHGLACFDGTCLYEYEDPTRREHRGWGTLVFNYNRTQVKNFLLASACFWLEEYHLDGLRVDAVASMLYLDYARDSGEWRPNPFGGNENLEAAVFLRELNEFIHRRFQGVLMIAEESTAWPLVTRPSWMGGLGFGMKWNMGWMHDTLEYLTLDPALRRHHQELLTFGLLYAFTENFMLPLSHDEVVHGKGSLLARMPGDRRQRFANLRLLYLYLWTYPGKKFLFMGNEFAQEQEWDFAGVLDWPLLEQRECRGVQTLICDLNGLYRSLASLHACEFFQEGFEWLDCHDPAQSVIVYLRRSGEHQAVIIFNFAATARLGYRVGVPLPGLYKEVLNSDAAQYGGGGGINGEICALPVFHMGQPCSLLVNLPPLTGLVLTPVQFEIFEGGNDG